MTDWRYLWRYIFIAVFVLLIFAGLITRLCFLHLGHNEALRERIVQLRQCVQTLVVGRGRVFDRNGDQLAMDLMLQNVWADPKVVAEKGSVEEIVHNVSPLLRLDPAIVRMRLQKSNRRFEYLKRDVMNDLAMRVMDLKEPGIYLEETSKRHYPQDQLMCHVVGFSNVEGFGSAGIEQRFDRYLRGLPGIRVSEKDGRRREVYERRSLELPSQDGADIYLTLDLTIQHIVEKALDIAMTTNHAKGAWAIVQVVKTGEILAMASRPGYDLNKFGRSQADERLNRAISYTYEPGSTFKISVIAAALNEGVVQPDQIFDCEGGRWFYRGRSLSDFHRYGFLSVADILKKSSNIGAAKIAVELGEDRLYDYLKKMGVGQLTGIDLPGEEFGIFNRRSKWTPISITRIAMGHEVAVTALQMLGIAGIMANDGMLMKPLVVRQIVAPSGHVIFSAQPEVRSKPIRPDIAAKMRELMARVTEDGGTGKRAALKDYRVAGKTGTAQKPINGRYSDSANMASFVGFLPVEDPLLNIIVIVDEPQPLHTGGEVSAPLFKFIAERVMRYIVSRPASWWLTTDLPSSIGVGTNS